MAGHCQDCDGCCRVLEVKEVQKGYGEPCRHLGKTLFGSGCQIYETRPDACKHYVCLWLDSQRRVGTEKMPESMRPDVTKVVMGWPWGTERDVLHVYPYQGFEENWKKSPIREHLQMVLARGGKVVIVTNTTRIALKGDMAIIGTEQEFADLLL